MTPDREKLALEAAREAIARKKDADDAAGSAALIRAGKWDDVSEVANAIAGAREALALLAETAPSGPVRVKPLEWAEPSMATNGCWFGRGTLHWRGGLYYDQGYSISHDGPLYYVIVDDGRHGEQQDVGEFRTLDAAKATAQADYERRVLSAIETAPSGEGEPVAWAPTPSASEDRAGETWQAYRFTDAKNPSWELIGPDKPTGYADRLRGLPHVEVIDLVPASALSARDETIARLTRERDDARARSATHWRQLQRLWDRIKGYDPDDGAEKESSRCRDCADEAGRCPHNGFSCNPQRAAEERIVALFARTEAAEARLAVMGEALSDLLSWFPEKPSAPEWRLEAGSNGADDAVTHARATLGQEVQDNEA